MGVDINLWFEQKIDGKWQPLEIPENLIPDGRDYEVFAFVAGVRRATVIKEADFHHRGLPRDRARPNMIDETDSMHNITYATVQEIKNAPWKKAKLENTYFYAFFTEVLPRIVGRQIGFFSHEEEEDIRVIMAFDS